MTVFPQRPFFILYKKVQVKLADIDFSMSAKVGYANKNPLYDRDIRRNMLHGHIYFGAVTRIGDPPSDEHGTKLYSFLGTSKLDLITQD